MCGSDGAQRLKAVGVRLRVVVLLLTMSSVVMLAMVSEFTAVELDGAVVTVNYPPFKFLAGLDAAAAILEAAALFLHLRNGGGGGGGGQHVKALIDGVVLLLLYASTAVTCTVASTFRREMRVWVGPGEPVYRSKVGLSMAAGFTVGVAAVVNQYVPQPF